MQGANDGVRRRCCRAGLSAIYVQRLVMALMVASVDDGEGAWRRGPDDRVHPHRKCSAGLLQMDRVIGIAHRAARFPRHLHVVDVVRLLPNLVEPRAI